MPLRVLSRVLSGSLGHLACTLPLPPGVMQTLYENDAGCLRAYYDEFPGYHSLGTLTYPPPLPPSPHWVRLATPR